MLNLKFIQENKETVIRKLAVKNFDAKELVEKIISLDNERKNLQKESDDKQAEMNSISKQIGSLMKEGKKEEVCGHGTNHSSTIRGYIVMVNGSVRVLVPHCPFNALFSCNP